MLARFGQLGYLDDKYVKVVDSLNVVAGADFGDQLGIQEPLGKSRVRDNIYAQYQFLSKEFLVPAKVDLGVGVAVVEDHGEELSGWLQGGLLIHLVR